MEMQMEAARNNAAWVEAQKIVISEDLVVAARQQLQFLFIVDQEGCLYDGPALDRAINRYNLCWLPLLARHSDSPLLEGPLIVPLDCEWIWHCHRLSPVRYKDDCETLYGKILDVAKVQSITQGSSSGKTEEIWNKMYPNEPYKLYLDGDIVQRSAAKPVGDPGCTNYDLAAAVKRQSSFFYQVSRSSMKDQCFLKEAMARYKAFLYLVRKNKSGGTSFFSVPTYDIDLMWHCHMLRPVSYCKDTTEILGEVLDHDDTDSDRKKGRKLDVGFTKTTESWEETYGRPYWKAGAMYRGCESDQGAHCISSIHEISACGGCGGGCGGSCGGGCRGGGGCRSSCGGGGGCSG
ncbi:hypothetical protein MLD38_024683 [Melastoma candidum]|uniref:Uncharacterized protein n=1 Tax=Melastoma candidum TaxID=119954 RepID=A0ACB9NSR2_9MYRT|nr:hypothetical protein MLD38_024683 [Melastoma candidum]